MQTYSCDPDVFFDVADPGGMRREEVRDTINHLADCYSLDGKTVLSVGAGRACEEYHLMKRGCRLHLVDNNGEGTVADPVMRSMTDRDTGLLYTLGDFRRYKGDQSADVLYFSGYYPDEARREFIYRKLPGPHAIKWRLLGPFSRSVMRATRALKPGGLLLVQSYYGGVEMKDHQDYIRACESQLSRAGMTLMDVYCFSRTTGVKFFAAIKGKPIQRGELARFHGRARSNEAIMRVY